MKESKTQKISIRLPLEDYGWLMRYCEKNDLTMSQIMRKAVRMYILAVQQQQIKKQQTKEKQE